MALEAASYNQSARSAEKLPEVREVFRAKEPEALKKPTWKKVARVVYNIFSVIIFPIGLCRLIGCLFHRILGGIIIPAQISIVKGKERISGLTQNMELSSYRKKLLSKGGEEISIITFDGKELDAMYFKGKKEKPTMIFFGGNGGGYEIFAANLWYLKNQGINLVFFNYRGVGRSKGIVTCRGLALDGEAVYQYVRDRLGVDDNKIILYGHSIGGGISAELASRHPRVHVINDRSFSSLEKEVKMLCSERAGGFWGSAASKIIGGLGWRYDAVNSWKQIKGRKMVITHKLDGIILPGARLKEALEEDKDIAGGLALENQSSRGFVFQTYVSRDFAKEGRAQPAAAGYRRVIEEWTDLFWHNCPFTPCEQKEIERFIVSLPEASFLENHQ